MLGDGLSPQTQSFKVHIYPKDLMDLLKGLFRGAVFHHGGVPENSPLALMVRFPSLMGRSPNALMGRFASWNFPGKQPIKKRGVKRLLRTRPY